VRLREATLADQRAVAALRVQTWRSAYAGIVPAAYLDAMDPLAQGERRAARYAGRPASDVDFVAERGGDLVGFVHGGRYRDDDAPAPQAGEVYALYVRPTAQGGGAGTALLAAALLALRAGGLAPVLLWVLADNHSARGFYERHGFALDGGTHTYEVGGAVLPEVRYRLGA
jgi:ribosomal protein S18 acetylase RimI-like enzyme